MRPSLGAMARNIFSVVVLSLALLVASSRAELSTDSPEEEDLRNAAVEKGKLQWDLLQSKTKVRDRPASLMLSCVLSF